MASNLGEYWTRKRPSRRTVLRGAGVGVSGLAAAALIGCGGDDDTATTTPTAPGATATAAPGEQTPTSEIKRGGHLVLPTTTDPDSLDILSTTSFQTTYPTGAAYSRIIKYDVGDGEAAPGSMSGDLAEHWEQPSETEFIFTLREGVTFDERAPTNGRALSMDDVVASWDKYESSSSYRSALSHSASDAAPVESIEAIDDRRFRVTLAFPDATFMQTFAWPYNYWVMPTESMDGGFNASADMRGTGPWMLREHRPGVGSSYDRNPNWHGGPDKPYLDSFEWVQIQDEAQAEAQFRSGAVHHGGVSNENIPTVLREVANTTVVATAPAAGAHTFNFSWQDGQPWHDIRVRRAMSLAYDRNTFVDVIEGTDEFAAAGMDVRRYWGSPMSAAYGDDWLDPTSDAFGPGSQWFEHNVAEARALLDAAGYDASNPLEADFFYAPHYGRDWHRRAELTQSMYLEAGIVLHLQPVDYSTGWVPLYLRAKGDFSPTVPGRGATGMWTNGPRASAGHWLLEHKHHGGANNSVGTTFPELAQQIEDMRSTMDPEAYREAVHNVQRECVDLMTAVPAQTTLGLIYPTYTWLKNADRTQIWPGGQVGFQTAAEWIPELWMDV